MPRACAAKEEAASAGPPRAARVPARPTAPLPGAREAAGCPLLKPETGPLQPEALALYARSGCERRRPFGKYADDPLSVFMHKRIGQAAPAG